MTAKRGRASAASQLIAVPGSSARLPAPDDLSDEAKAFWESIVNSLAPDYFRPSDVPLLHAYVTAAELKAQADKAVKRDGIIIKGKANPAVKIALLQGAQLASLAVKLRLCPSTRMRAVSAKLREVHSAARPWDAK